MQEQRKEKCRKVYEELIRNIESNLEYLVYVGPPTFLDNMIINNWKYQHKFDTIYEQFEKSGKKRFRDYLEKYFIKTMKEISSQTWDDFGMDSGDYDPWRDEDE